MTIYYVSSAGNNANNGLTLATAWQTLAHVQSKLDDNTIQGSDRVRLNPLDDFTGSLKFDGKSGTAGARTTLEPSASGAGRNPKILHATSYGVQVKDSEYFTITDIDTEGSPVSDAGGGVTAFTGGYDNIGIDITSTRDAGSRYRGITVSGCNLSHAYRLLMVRADGHAIGYDGVSITNCTLFNGVDSGIQSRGAASDSYVAGYADYLPMSDLPDALHGQGNGAVGRTTHANISVTGCTVYNIFGDDRITLTSSGDPFKMSNTDNDPASTFIADSLARDSGQNCHGQLGGMVAFWIYDCDSCIIRNCVALRCGGPYATNDGGGFDIDGNCASCVVEHCLSSGCFGPGFQIGDYGGTGCTDCTVRFCVSYGDGTGDRAGMKLFGGGNTDSRFYHNTIINPGGAGLHDEGNGAYFFNNIIVVEAGHLLISGSTYGSILEGNTFWRTGGTFAADDVDSDQNPTSFTSFATWAAEVPPFSSRTGNAFEDPTLVMGAPTGTETAPTDYRGAYLLAGSPALASGLDLTTVPAGSVPDPGGALDDYFYGEAYTVASPNVGAAEEAVVATPTISPNGGPVSTGQEVTLASTTPASTLYYTTDGTDPDSSDEEYDSSDKPTLSSAGSVDFRAIAYAEGYNPSPVAQATFTVSNLNNTGQGSGGTSHALMINPSLGKGQKQVRALKKRLGGIITGPARGRR